MTKNKGGLDQRERIIRQTQEQFRRRKKHKVVTDTELAKLLSSYRILNQDKVKNKVRRYFTGRIPLQENESKIKVSELMSLPMSFTVRVFI